MARRRRRRDEDGHVPLGPPVFLIVVGALAPLMLLAVAMGWLCGTIENARKREQSNGGK